MYFGNCLLQLLFVYQCYYISNSIANRTVVGQESHIKDDRYPHLYQQMIPAKPVLDLKSRSVGPTSFLRHDHILHFIEDDASNGQKPSSGDQSSFSAEVRLVSEFPIFFLEEHDHLLKQVVCHESTINLIFYSEAALSSAWQEVQGHPELLIITSHLGCNAENERKPYIASRGHRDRNILIFRKLTTAWKDSFHTIDISFGTQYYNPLQRRSGVQTSQAITTTIVGPSSIQLLSRPTTKPTETSVHGASLNMSWTDVQILPPKFPGIVNSSIIDASVPPPGLTLKCKNCSLTGNASMTHGLLTNQGPIDSSNTSENAIQFFQHGYIELATYFDAHVEIESIVVPSASLVSYTAPFPDIDILGFTIPFIAEVGVKFRPQLTFGVELQTGLNFTYGFAAHIPQNSTVVIDVHNTTRSNVTGFQQTQITALPFQAVVDSVNLTIAASFTPQILLTIGILDSAISASTGAFLDLPKLEATVSKVNHANKSCDPVTPAEDIKDYIFDSLTQIVPKVDADIGVFAEIDEKLSGNKQEALTYKAWNKTWTLPTACYSFDAGKKAYVSPTALPTMSSPKMAAPPTPVSSDAPKVPGSDSKSESSRLRPIDLLPSTIPSFFAFVVFFLALCLL